MEMQAREQDYCVNIEVDENGNKHKQERNDRNAGEAAA